VHHDWSCKARLEWVLFPLEIFFVVLVSLEHLSSQNLIVIVISLCAGGIGFVLEIETDRQLEVELDSTALMWSLESIEDFDINLGAVECTIGWVNFPWLAELIECIGQSFLCFVPKLLTSKTFLWSSGKFKLKVETKDSINVVQKVKIVQDFILYLVFGTELMCIVLTESSYSG